MHRQLARVTLLATLAGVAALAACADHSAPMAPGTPAPTTTTAAGMREILDSLYGTAAGDIDTALATLDSAARRESAAWLDSVVQAVVLPGASAAARDARVMATLAAAPAPITSNTTLEKRLTTRGRKVTLRIETVQKLSFPDGVKVLLEDYTRDYIRTLGDDDQPLPNSAVVGYEREQRLALNACPDASGRAGGLYDATYSTNAVKAGGLEIPTPDLADYQHVETLNAGVGLFANDAAELSTFEDEMTHRLERSFFHNPARTGSAKLRHNQRSFGELYTRAEHGDLQNVTGDYDNLADMERKGGINTMLHDYDLVVDKVARIGERLWRSGACVEVREVGGAVQPASPGSVVTLRPYVVSLVDGGVRHAGTVDATASGGTLDASAKPLADPATFHFTASNAGGGRVEFHAVSKYGIGRGEVSFTTIETGATLTYSSIAAYTLKSADAFTGEQVTGAINGTELLKSQLHLVPRGDVDEGDLRAYSVVATTHVEMDANGEGHSRGYDNGRLVGDASFRIIGSGTSHNPADRGDPEFDWHDFDQFPASRDTAGTLVIFRQGDKYYYGLDLQVSGIAPTFEAAGTMTYKCTDVAPATVRRQSWSNATRVYTDEQTGDCIPYGGGYTADLPDGFGAIVLARTQADPVTHRSNMFIGEFDPRTGIIAGEEERTISDCTAVNRLDPLQISSQLHRVKSWFGDIDYAQGSCSLHYTVRWSFSVAPLM